MVVANSQAHQSASLKSLLIPKQEISLRAKGHLFVIIVVLIQDLLAQPGLELNCIGTTDLVLIFF